MKFSLSVAALSLLASASTALAGLEDAKYSTVLNSGNIDSTLASQSEGTLVAFFAPWCGHCKNLEPVWTKVAQAFEGDDRCKVAHFNADEPANKPVAQKYGVSGYPTLKFIQPASKGGAVEDYRGARSEEALLAFLNEKCGTHKLPGGLLGDLAGRIPSLDSLASLYLHPTATRPDLLASASSIASSLTDSSSSLVSYYLKVFNKFADASGEQLEEAKQWVEKERARLGKLAGKKGQVAVKKLEEARMKQNILAAFTSVSASASSLSSVASATASSAVSVASASGSSAASVASASGSSAASAVSASGSSVVSAATAAASDAASTVSASGSSVVSAASAAATDAASTVSAGVEDAQASASSMASQASQSAGSVYGEASGTVSSVVEKATARVREEL
ncbi:hypothetical protein JCM11251_002316 [Rhodosporidiobolus azoricus]